MQDSFFTRFWNVIKPPEAGESAKPIALRRRQRRLIWITLCVFVLIGAGIWIFNYYASAPERADQEFQAGMKLMRPGKYPSAIEHFTRALAISSQLPNAYLERGNAHRTLGETDAALADFQAAADMDGSLTEAQNGIAMIYIDRHDLPHALQELNKSLALHPTIDAYYQRGQILEAQGEHQKAIDDFDKAIAEQRDAPYMYLARAEAKDHLGDTEGARADRNAAAQIMHRR